MFKKHGIENSIIKTNSESNIVKGNFHVTDKGIKVFRDNLSDSDTNNNEMI